MSATQIVVVLVAGASAIIILGCVLLVVMLRLQRVVRTQLETLDEILGPLRTDQGPDAPHDP
ncbi:MAG: hypothetical protein ACRDSR_03420 [Pseudonocardiaceae bacterium]